MLSDMWYVMQPLVAVAVLGTWVWSIQDALRSHRPWLWVLLVVFVPVLMVPFYVLNFRVMGTEKGEGAVDKRLKNAARLKALMEEARLKDVPAVHLEIAELFHEQGKWREALASLSRLLDQDEENLRGHFLAGSCLLAIGQPEKAVGHLEYLLGEDPRAYYGKARLLLANALLELGRTGDARREYGTVLERFSMPEAAVRLGRILAGEGHHEEAVAVLRVTLQKAGEIPSANLREQRPWIREAAGDLKRYEVALARKAEE